MRRCSFFQIQEKFSNTKVSFYHSHHDHDHSLIRYELIRNSWFPDVARLWGTILAVCRRTSNRPVSLNYILAEFDMWILRLIIMMDHHEDKFDDSFIDQYLNVLNITINIDVDPSGVIDHIYYPFVKQYLYPLIQEVANVNAVYCGE